MLVLRIKIDSWSKGIDEGIRQRNRELLESEYIRLPSQRLWLYLHFVRTVANHEDIDTGSPQIDWSKMPETLVAHGR